MTRLESAYAAVHADLLARRDRLCEQLRALDAALSVTTPQASTIESSSPVSASPTLSRAFDPWSHGDDGVYRLRQDDREFTIVRQREARGRPLKESPTWYVLRVDGHEWGSWRQLHQAKNHVMEGRWKIGPADGVEPDIDEEKDLSPEEIERRFAAAKADIQHRRAMNSR